jgi:hypothetical protein
MNKVYKILIANPLFNYPITQLIDKVYIYKNPMKDKNSKFNKIKIHQNKKLQRHNHTKMDKKNSKKYKFYLNRSF